MKRREVLAGMGGLAVSWGINGMQSAVAQPGERTAAIPQKNRSTQPPNVIFFMADQQRWDAIGRLNPLIKTPNLDRLAKQGILFKQATCQAPMCVPSRNALMFGLYPSQLGVRSNGSHGIGDKYFPHNPLPALLQKAGYQTAGFGKTHRGHTDEIPSTHGFEVRVVGAREVGLERGARYQDDEDPEGLAAYRRETASFGIGEEEVPGYIGSTSQVPERDHRDGWVAEQCLKFLDSGEVAPNRPLFLYLSFLKPHAGFNVPKRFEDLYRIEDIPDTIQPPWSYESDTHLAYRNEASKSIGARSQRWYDAWVKMSPLERRRTTLRYYANCSWLESYFGLALDKLEKLGRLQNSLIIFTSDHGELLGERNFEFSKYCLYDSSVRVPVIVSGTAVPEAARGSIDESPVELVDLLPTIAAATGTSIPAGLPGIDLLSSNRHAGSFCEFHDSGSPAYMWRNKDWKLIVYMACPLGEALIHVNQPHGELYNLREDPHEWNNLYADATYSAIREQLKTELLMHLACAWSSHPLGRG